MNKILNRDNYVLLLYNLVFIDFNYMDILIKILAHFVNN